MKQQNHYKSPIGLLCIEAEDEFITGINLDNDADTLMDTENEVIVNACNQLQEYFDGKRTEFSIKIKMQGTDFQKAVWTALQNIPFGETRSYGDIANMIGNPKACRAVGGANNKNNIMIVVPCHRVIGSNGKMVGFGAGIDVKEYLLELEKKGMENKNVRI